MAAIASDSGIDAICPTEKDKLGAGVETRVSGVGNWPEAGINKLSTGVVVRLATSVASTVMGGLRDSRGALITPEAGST